MGAIHRGIGVTCPSWLVPTPNGGCIDPTLSSGGIQRDITSPTPTAVQYASAPGCYVVDLATDTCMLSDGTLEACTIIRECDPLTGAVHCQYGPYPGQAVQPGLPFCSGSGPNTIYSPVPLTLPTGPSTAYVPSSVLPQGAIAPGTPFPLPSAPASSTPATGLTPGSGPTGTTPASGGGFNPMAFLTEATFAGIPNWVWLASGAVLFMMVKK
jgi:hypothetical protein